MPIDSEGLDILLVRHISPLHLPTALTAQTHHVIQPSDDLNDLIRANCTLETIKHALSVGITFTPETPKVAASYGRADILGLYHKQGLPWTLNDVFGHALGHSSGGLPRPSRLPPDLIGNGTVLRYREARWGLRHSKEAVQPEWIDAIISHIYKTNVPKVMAFLLRCKVPIEGCKLYPLLFGSDGRFQDYSNGPAIKELIEVPPAPPPQSLLDLIS